VRRLRRIGAAEIIWKRNTDDPLVRLLLDKYSLHLLAVPRERVSVGDLYIYDNKRVVSPCNIIDLYDPPLEFPPTNIGERLADIADIVSYSVSTKLGLGLLDNFLNALGAGGLVHKVRFAYESKNTLAVKFRFTEATRDFLNLRPVFKELMTHELAEDPPLYERGHRYYMASAVVRTRAISILTDQEQANVVVADMGIAQVAEGSAELSVEENDKRGITYRGQKNLAFGVELHELQYNQKTHKMTPKMPPKNYVPVRGSLSSSDQPPAFIGGPEDDVFLVVD